MTINLGTPKPQELKPRITVVGVGGAGGNAVNNMISANLEGVEFVACNTDAQALSYSTAPRKVQLGINLTQGLGSGSKPEVGRAAAMEAKDEILEHLAGSHMAFVTAGMGGGTGTGAAPVIAQLARDAGILTVGVITKPFEFEGAHRMRLAEAGIAELQNYVDTLLIIPNQNLFRVANERTTFADAFKMADDVLHAGVRGVTDLMVMPGLINLDFADVKTVMEEMGKAMMGTGQAEGERRAIQAAEAAISNPLLEDTSMRGARGVLINITGGPDMTLFEVDEAVKRIKDEVADDANIIFGSTFDDRMEGRMRISIVATGIDVAVDARERKPQLQVVSAVGGGGRGGMMSSFGRETEMVREEPRLTPVRAIEQIERSAPRAFDPAPITATRSSAEPLAQRAMEPIAQRTMEPVAQRAMEPMAQRIVTETQALRAEPVTAREPDVRQPDMRAPLQPTRAATAAPQTMLRTVTATKPVDAEHFIAPAPIEPKSSSSAPMRRPDPFAEAAVANGRRPEGRSLLERMTGLARKKEAGPVAKADEPAKAQAPLARTFPPASRAPLLEKAEVAAPVVTAPAPAKAEPAAQLKVESPARAAQAAREDDLLDIPAFLRRQTN